MFCLDQNVSTMQFMEILNQILQGVQSFHATVTLISIWYQSRPEGSTQQRTTSCQMQEGALAVDGTDTGWRKSKRKLLTVCVTAHVHYTTCHTHTHLTLICEHHLKMLELSHFRQQLSAKLKGASVASYFEVLTFKSAGKRPTRVHRQS